MIHVSTSVNLRATKTPHLQGGLEAAADKGNTVKHLSKGISGLSPVAEVARLQADLGKLPNSCESGYKKKLPSVAIRGGESRKTDEMRPDHFRIRQGRGNSQKAGIPAFKFHFHNGLRT